MSAPSDTSQRRSFGKTCPECGVEYWMSIEQEEKLLTLYKAGSVVNLVGSPGAGKSFLAMGSIAWNLLHLRIATVFIITNVSWERCTAVTEYDIEIEEDGVVKRVHKRIPDTEQCGPPHPRIIGIENLDELLVEAAKIQKQADALKEDYRIVFVQDEAPVSQVGAGSKVVSSYTATSAGLMSLITLMRRYGGGGMTYVPISLSEDLLMTKLRSEGDSSIPGLVTAVMSKDPNTVREIASGWYRGKKLSTRYILDKPLIEYVAVIPNLYGWEPSIKWVPPITSLACPLDRMEVGTISFTTKGVSGLGTGKLPDGRAFRPESLITALTGIHPSKVPDRVLQFLRGGAGSDEEEDVSDEQMRQLEGGEEAETPSSGEDATDAYLSQARANPEPSSESKLDKKKRNLIERVRTALAAVGPEVSSVNEFEQRAKTHWNTVLKLVEEGHIDQSELPEWSDDE